jgi:hypothetical protein
MRAHYDFSQGVRGKYVRRYLASTNLVVIDPDLAGAFPDERAVNAALRSVLAVACTAVKPGRAAAL